MDYIMIPSSLEGFSNIETEEVSDNNGTSKYIIRGELEEKADERICPVCGSAMHVRDSYETHLHHVPFGKAKSEVVFSSRRYSCRHCGHSETQGCRFKSSRHRITDEAERYVRDLLSYGLPVSTVSAITGLNRKLVKEVDKNRLEEMYTIGGKALKRPPQARLLGIDEFSLHKGHQYAVVIMDLETGHVLYLAKGRKKQTVYDFIDFVGEDWMDGVEAVACDMNSDFQEAFEELCCHIQTVFDHYHIVQHFNREVVDRVRKDEQARLIREGNTEGAKSLKGSKYILMSTKDARERKDREAEEYRKPEPKPSIFGGKAKEKRGGNASRYEDLVEENELFLSLDIVKEKLKNAYKLSDEVRMAEEIAGIMDFCDKSGNRHLERFSKMLGRHWEGIVAHGCYCISSGRVEGVNNLIKTVRRQAYGYRDDDYFFLKIMDASRRMNTRERESKEDLTA